jgi:hypothetical protein
MSLRKIQPVIQSMISLFIALSTMGSQSLAADFVRWTGKDDANGAFPHVVETLAQKLGVALETDAFKLNEDRDLAFTHFSHYLQTSGGIPLEGASIRIWTDRSTGRLIQMEANIERPKSVLTVTAAVRAELTRRFGRSTNLNISDFSGDGRLHRTVTRALAKHDDAKASLAGSRLVWANGKLVAVSRLKGKRGEHEVRVDALSGMVIGSAYVPYPQSDELAVEADVFPVYEEFEGTILARKRVTLRHILPTVRMSTVDPFSPLRDTRYLESRMNPQAAATPEGRRAGYWSEATVRQRVTALSSAVPEFSNAFQDGGVSIAGRFCSVMIHPDAINTYKNFNFTPKFSAFANYDWKETTTDGKPDYEMLINASYYGKPLATIEESLARPATRHPFHDPQTYLNEGFDELQVYHGVSQFFDSLHTRGFTDPELSTRPFLAFLFNPDIAMRDNAFYTDDTINFTTYSPTSDNAARNNETIWHELGHGLMDRLMGNAWGGYLKLADTGGLSEGMADFTADIVLRTVVGNDDFPGRSHMRINNHTGFLLTNEVHDDGEAYGGAMHDILDRAMSQWGVEGIHKVADLTMETMRLTRYHPHLTAADFFDHMLFADELGRPGVRESGELQTMISESLASRNFVRDGQTSANLSIKHQGKEVLAGEPGSRDHEIVLELGQEETKPLNLEFSVAEGDQFKFHYPLKARLYKSERGALQGAIHWDGEERGPVEFTVAAANQSIDASVTVTGKCDYVNREDGSCSDYVYLLLFDETVSSDHPVAKKRFYARIKTKK